MDGLGWIAFFGVLLFVGFGYLAFRRRKIIYKPNAKDFLFSSTVLLLVKNQEKHIEGVMRQILRLQKDLDARIQLIVVDLNSEDQTVPILQRLCYPDQCFMLIEALYGEGVEEWKKYSKGKNVYIIEMMGRIRSTQVIRQVKSIIWNDVAGTNNITEMQSGQ